MKRFIGILGVLCVGVGCVNREEEGLTAAQQASAGDALGVGIEESAQGFGKVSDFASADAPCVVLSGDTADLDQDSIPNNAKLTFSCTGTALGFTSALTGTMGVVDDQPAVAAWAFTGMRDMNWTLTGPNGGSVVRDADGMLVSTQGSAGGPYTTRRMLMTTTVFTTDRGAKATVEEDINWNVTFTPMVSWTPGALIVRGTVNASGNWNVTVGENAASAMLSTPMPLTLDPTCFSRVTAGKVVGTYVDTNDREGSITVTWSGCGMRTVTATR